MSASRSTGVILIVGFELVRLVESSDQKDRAEHEVGEAIENVERQALGYGSQRTNLVRR